MKGLHNLDIDELRNDAERKRDATRIQALDDPIFPPAFLSHEPRTFSGLALRLHPLRTYELPVEAPVSRDALAVQCRTFCRSAYQQWSRIHQFNEERASPGDGALAPEDWQWLGSQGLGLSLHSALYAAWHAAYRYYVRTNDACDEVRLLLWGSHFDGAHEAGRNPFYADVAKVSSWFPPELQDVYRHRDHYEVMQQWAKASGATHRRSLDASAAVAAKVIDNLLSHHPFPSMVSLDQSMGTLALKLAMQAESESERQKRLAFYLFQVFQRVYAYELVPGLVRWRSEWLRGPKADPRAIRGASTYSAAITHILNEHVFYRVKGHWSGGNNVEPKAATYRLRIPIWRGGFTSGDFARSLSIPVRGRLPNLPTRRKL